MMNVDRKLSKDIAKSYNVLTLRLLMPYIYIYMILVA